MKTYKLLESDKIHLVQPALVERYGRIQAEFLSQLHYWTKKEQGLNLNGKTWIFNTYEQWADQFKISRRHMVRIVHDLIKKGIIFAQKLSSHKSNRTNYYSLNYEAINELQPVANLHSDKMSLSSGQNVPMVIQRITNKDQNNKSVEFFQDSTQQVEQVRDLETNELKKVDLENGVDQSHLFTTIHQSAKSTTVQDMISHWNQAFPNSKAKLAKDLSQNLMGAFIHRFEKNMEKWQHYCAKIASSSYLMGEGFVLSLAWALKFSTIDRILKNELGVKDIQFVPSIQTLENQAIEHVNGVVESDACKQTRRLLFKKLGAATYVSWFTKVQFLETEEGRVIFKADNSFVEDYIMQKFGGFLVAC